MCCFNKEAVMIRDMAERKLSLCWKYINVLGEILKIGILSHVNDFRMTNSFLLDRYYWQ